MTPWFLKTGNTVIDVSGDLWDRRDEIFDWLDTNGIKRFRDYSDFKFHDQGRLVFRLMFRYPHHAIIFSLKWSGIDD